MKKSILLSLILSAFILFPLSSCNEESDHSADQRLTSDLPGAWKMSSEQYDEDNNLVLSRNVEFVFTSKTFAVSTVRTTLSRTSSFYVRGTWSIKNEILQLYYELNSLTTSGLSAEEISALKSTLLSNNEMLDDLKNNPQAYGMPIEISRKNSYTGTMKLSKNADFAGIYTLSDGSLIP